MRTHTCIQMMIALVCTSRDIIRYVCIYVCMMRFDQIGIWFALMRVDQIWHELDEIWSNLTWIWREFDVVCVFVLYLYMCMCVCSVCVCACVCVCVCAFSHSLSFIHLTSLHSHTLTLVRFTSLSLRWILVRFVSSRKKPYTRRWSPLDLSNSVSEFLCVCVCVCVYVCVCVCVYVYVCAYVNFSLILSTISNEFLVNFVNYF